MERGGWLAPRLCHFAPDKDTGQLGGPQRWSERVQKNSPAPDFDPRTVHLVATRYTY